MTGQQIIDTCRAIAHRQYEDDHAGAAQHEIELLRTKVLELASLLELRTPPTLSPADLQRLQGIVWERPHG